MKKMKLNVIDIDEQIVADLKRDFLELNTFDTVLQIFLSMITYMPTVSLSCRIHSLPPAGRL